MKVLLCFGNELIEQDSLAKKLADKIKMKDVEVIKCNDPEECFEAFRKKEIFILDVVKNLKEVKLIKDLNKLKTHSLDTLHDFDLAFFLKLMKETGQMKDIKIIGIPMEGDEDKLVKKIESILKR